MCGSVANVITNIVEAVEKWNLILTVDSEMPKTTDLMWMKLNWFVQRVLDEKRTIFMVCWFDSGCAPFAQWHYPFENEEKFDSLLPVYMRAVDQTRGWFYSTGCWYNCLWKTTYKRCLSLAISGQKWKKMVVKEH